jgi:tripartite-type tricarboxylate transporter receptor subunit TctC
VGFFGSSGLSTDIRNLIAADISAVAADPTVGKRLIPLAAVARGGTPDEFAAAIERQRSRMAATIKLLGTN